MLVSVVFYLTGQLWAVYMAQFFLCQSPRTLFVCFCILLELGSGEIGKCRASKHIFFLIAVHAVLDVKMKF